MVVRRTIDQNVDALENQGLTISHHDLMVVDPYTSTFIAPSTFLDDMHYLVGPDGSHVTLTVSDLEKLMHYYLEQIEGK